MDYQEFIASKKRYHQPMGLTTIPPLHPSLFPFQHDIVTWALKRGRAAIFAQTGLGKSLMELSWGYAIHQMTGGKILLITPLAISAQMIREAAKFGMYAKQCANQSEVIDGINITNYEKLQHFDLSQFVGVILDESSILKSFTGRTRNMLIERCKVVPYRLAASATPAPNDYTELGNHSEFLGVMSMSGMLSTYFTHDGGNTSQWRLKGHANTEFWQWMCSWAVLLRKPSDLDYDDDAYNLPPLNEFEHIVSVPGDPARTMRERIRARRDTLLNRVIEAVQITPTDRPFVWWCNLNDEADMLRSFIPDAVEVRGTDKEHDKERKLLDFSEGRIRVLVTKPTICGFGMNWQHCADTGFVGLNDSFEQLYQAIRRFWRFGQSNPVNVHYVSSSIEGAVIENLKRKENDAERMGNEMVSHMAGLTMQALRGDSYNPENPMNIPDWLFTEVY